MLDHSKTSSKPWYITTSRTNFGALAVAGTPTIRLMATWSRSGVDASRDNNRKESPSLSSQTLSEK